MANIGSKGSVRKSAFRLRGRSVQTLEEGGAGVGAGPATDAAGDRVFLQIKPALPDRDRDRMPRRAHSTLSGSEPSPNGIKDDFIGLQAVGEGRVQLARSPQEKDRLPDRISLDRRGLSSVPNIVGEPGLRLLSLQHNLISSLVGVAPLDLARLVFLDLYDNQIDKITCLDRLYCLRVLLMGKNRIRRMEGLATLVKLEVLDLHGNKISKVGGLTTLVELKVLNLAGNQIKCIGSNELLGMESLCELNLKRNRLRKLMGFHNTPKLQKLYLSNNELQGVEDMSSLAEASSLVEVSLDGNPVALGGDCTPFLVSYLPNLVTLTNMNITEQVRGAAMAWRRNKEAAAAAYSALGGAAQHAARRDQVIHNARTNWELLRTENKCFAPPTPQPKQIESSPNPAPAVSEPETQNVVQAPAPTEKVEPQITEPNKPQSKKIQRSNTARKPIDRRVNFSERSASQDTETSHSTSTSSDLRLPPIMLPIISTLESVKVSDTNEPFLKRWESISSVEPIADSSYSSLPSSSSETEEEVKNVKRAPTAFRRRTDFSSMRSKSVCDAEGRRPKSTNIDNSENASNLSTNTNMGSVMTNSSTSSGENNKLRRENSLNGRLSRNTRSATLTRRNERSSSLNRAATARVKSGKNIANLKSSEPTSKTIPTSKDREQGVDYLVEVGGGAVVAWGAGAVRRLARDWEWERARAVTEAHFHYAHFATVAQALPDLKAKFPNVSHITVRATGLQWLGQLHALAELRGLTGLTVLDEGNPITAKRWRQYAIYRLRHWGLKKINDEDVSEEEVAAANETYCGLSELVLSALPEAPLQPLLARLGRAAGAGGGVNGGGAGGGGGARSWLRAADPALRDVIAKEALQWRKGSVSQEDMSWRVRGRSQLSGAIELACGAAQRLATLEEQWPAILVEAIQDALRDFMHMDSHVKQLLDSLMDDA